MCAQKLGLLAGGASVCENSLATQGYPKGRCSRVLNAKVGRNRFSLHRGW